MEPIDYMMAIFAGVCIGLAGLYYFLNSPFLALMEILIYVGAVCVTIVFGVMLSEPDELARQGRRAHPPRGQGPRLGRGRARAHGRCRARREAVEQRVTRPPSTQRPR